MHVKISKKKQLPRTVKIESVAKSNMRIINQISIPDPSRLVSPTTATGTLFSDTC